MKDLRSISRYFLIYGTILIYLELVLRFHMTDGFAGNYFFFLCFIPSHALFLTLLNGFFKDRKNILISSVLLLLLEVYYIAQLIYYKNFGSLFSASMAGMGMDAVTNFGWTLTDVIRSNLGGIFLMIFPAFLIGGLSFFRLLKQEKISSVPRMVILILTLPAWLLGVQATKLDGTSRQSAYIVYQDMLSDTDTTAAHLGALTTSILETCAAHSIISSSEEILLTNLAVDTDVLLAPDHSDILLPPDDTDAPQPSDGEDIPPSSDKEDALQNTPADSDISPDQNGDAPAEEKKPLRTEPQIYEEIDLQLLAEQAGSAKIKELSLYLDGRGATASNEYTGMFEGYNLIYICAESFWTYAIDEQVTPTLYKMANHGILLNNYYNSFKNTTTNGEYAFATGLWPDFSGRADSGTDVGSFPQSAKCFMPMGLGDLFEQDGVPSYAFHNYYGEYYRRFLSWPNLGYTCKFAGTGMTFTSSWPASDLELMEQSVDDYIQNDRFHAYYMTFSGHGPYSRYNAMYRENIDYVKENMPEGLPDDAYGYLAGSREFDKAMEYLLKRLEEAGKLDNTVIVIAGDHYPYNLSIEAAGQLAGHELDTDFEMYKSTCIIYNAGMEENIVTDTYCCNADILPTILNLFGIKYDSRLIMGRDIFAVGVHKAVLYNKSFITSIVRYNRKTGETVWSEAAANYSAEARENYLEQMISLIDSEFYASLQILKLNYYQYAWYQSGLMTEEELAAEKQRAEQAQAENERYNASLLPPETEEGTEDAGTGDEAAPEGAVTPEGEVIPEGAVIPEGTQL